MKTKCDFCKTEFEISNSVNGGVKCPICGYVWRVRSVEYHNGWLKLFSALCALLAVIIFGIVVLVVSKHKQQNMQALSARVSNYTITTDDSGIRHLVVDGEITNNTDEIYGVPGVTVLLYSDSDILVQKQTFMPSATLIDSGDVINFSHVLSMPNMAVKRIDVKLVEYEQKVDR